MVSSTWGVATRGSLCTSWARQWAQLNYTEASHPEVICPHSLSGPPDKSEWKQASVQRRSLPSTPHCGGQRFILATISNHSRETEWSFTLPTRRAPVQPAQPTACSL